MFRNKQTLTALLNKFDCSVVFVDIYRNFLAVNLMIGCLPKGQKTYLTPIIGRILISNDVMLPIGK